MQYELNDQELELQKQLQQLNQKFNNNHHSDYNNHFSYNDNDNDNEINETNEKPRPNYYQRLNYNIKCPICNKNTNLGKIKQHHQTKKCKILRCNYTDSELDEIANKILLLTIQKYD